MGGTYLLACLAAACDSPVQQPDVIRLLRALGEQAATYRDAFQSTLPELTAGLLGAMRAAFGEEGLQKLIAERSAQQIRTYAEKVDREQTVKGKLAALAALREAEGYMAGVKEEADGSLLLIENHCPICVAAQACSKLCDGELTVFRAVLGPTNPGVLGGIAPTARC